MVTTADGYFVPDIHHLDIMADEEGGAPDLELGTRGSSIYYDGR